MQKEVCTSRVSQIGLMFLATFKNKSRSVVSKRDLESAFGTCKAQTRPLGRAAMLLYLPFLFLKENGGEIESSSCLMEIYP